MKLSVDPDIRKVRIVEFLPDLRITPANFSKSVIQFKSSYRLSGSCHTFNVTTVGDLDSVSIPMTVRQDTWLEEWDGDSGPIRYELHKTSDGHPSLSPENPGMILEDGQSSHFCFLIFLVAGGPWKTKLPIQAPASKLSSPPSLSIPITTICEEDGDPSCLANLSITATFRTTEGTPLL